jgi:DNA-binding transcriptional MocR family regulator
MSRDGIHLWLVLPGYWTAEAFARAARDEGLSITPSNAFSSGPSDVNAIRISLGGGRDKKRIALALSRLSGLLASKPSTQHAVVI